MDVGVEMKMNEPNRYDLSPSRPNGTSILSHMSGKSKFDRPDTTKCQKLYFVKENLEFHYVGITNLPMASRLRIGLQAEGKNGYHGYKWKLHESKLSLIVWSFPDHSGKAFRLKLETIEAEVAYLIRTLTGDWPISQNEIHFHPSSSEARRIARLIVAQSQVERVHKKPGDV